MTCSEEGSVEEDLIGFAKRECHLVGGHGLAISLGAFSAHLEGVKPSRTGPLE
jgi:hypothetical protein